MSNKPSFQERKQSTKSDIDELFDKYCETRDEIGMKEEGDLSVLLKGIREVIPECADEIEKTFLTLKTDVRFGTILAGYIKSEIIRPIQRKYRNT